MTDMPRIVTVDPTGTVARIVRSAMDLLDLQIIQLDIPGGKQALEELSEKVNLVVAAFDVEEDMKGFELAMRAKRISEKIAILVLGDENDPSEFDEETALESPFVYMSRPLDTHQLLRVLVGGLDSHEKMVSGLKAPSGGGAASVSSANMGPVPKLDLTKAQAIIDRLLTDLGSMAIVLASRVGETLIESGAVGYIDRESLARTIIPIMTTNIGVKELIGGQVTTIQLYDGEDYDIFVLSVGLHHMLCVMFDGTQGSRQFGSVNRYGRKAVEDLIALLGADAFFIHAPVAEEPKIKRREQPKKKDTATDEDQLGLVPAEFGDGDGAGSAEAVVDESVIEQLEPIEDLNLDDLFGGSGDSDMSLFDDLDKLEELASESLQKSRKGTISDDEARELGILKN
jgi:hypothetical protein